jgi:hypothetical protein
MLRILEGLMTLQVRGGARERLSYRTLDVEQIGSVYETVMGFTVETCAGRSLAVRAGKNNRIPVFVELERLLAAKGKERIKFLKEEAERVQLSANLGKAIEAAKNVAELAAALDPIVDERGSPKKHAAAVGTPLLQPTDERRRTGSHYTPRSLTEPIVKYALEPAFERLGSQATPEQVLELKVCDPAMGSGAFLVEACRAIATKLVEAWNVHKDRKPIIPPDEDEDLHARRLVAQRCLYGVDKNPLATDLAKLSLWLATLARDHEFTFLDHALKSGDSLVGLTQAQIAAAHWDTSKSGLPLFRKLVKDRVAEATKGRAEIQAAPDDTARAIQEQRHRSLEAGIREIRLMGDAVIAAFFAEDKPRAREGKRAAVESWLGGSSVAWDKLAGMAATPKQDAHPLTPFHWEIEFPEVFARENGGFDAVVGNPPFLGGSKISGAIGKAYLQWLLAVHPGSHGNADLCAHFFRRGFSLLRVRAALGLIATNTIGQGDSRTTGLTCILREGAQILRALRRVKWPGDAAVIVSTIHVGKAVAGHSSILDGKQVKRISAFLLNVDIDSAPERLSSNVGLAYLGPKVYGQGFVFDNEGAKKDECEPIATMQRLITSNQLNSERVFPYIGGEEVFSSPALTYHRYVMDFDNFPLRRDPDVTGWRTARKELRDEWLSSGIVPSDYNEPVAFDWPELLAIAEVRVKPERQKLRDNPDGRRRKKFWWQFGRSTPALHKAVESLTKVLVRPRIGNAFAFAFLPVTWVCNEKNVIFAIDHFAGFAALSARNHELWSRFLSSTLKDDLQYTPSECLFNFPFPLNFKASQALESTGQAYYEDRAALMVARNEGMTKTYNRFHNPSESAEDIQRLRELHAAMDRAVLEAYGWRDLAARAAPIFLDETTEDDHTYQGRLFWPSDFRDEVLARLLALNAERHAEEVRLGIAPGMKGKTEDEKDEDQPEE